MSTRPALFDLEEPEHVAGPIETAANATLDVLNTSKTLEPRHALIIQMIRSLAMACDKGLAAPKVSIATTTMLRQLSDLMVELPAPAETAEASDGFAQVIQELRNVA